MKWARVRPGHYTAGPYAILSLETHRPIWTASGPNFTAVCGTKAEAQQACQRAAHARLIDISDAYTVVPVVNDVAEYAGQRCSVYPAGEQIITLYDEPTDAERRATWFNLPEGGPW